MSNQYFNQISNPIIESPMETWRNREATQCLIGNECLDCHKKFYPPQLVCTICHKRKLKKIEYSGVGKILNIEINNIPQITVMGFRELLPRTFATIELEEGPIVIGEIIDNDAKRIKKGDCVKKTLRRMARSNNTTWTYGVKFLLDTENS